MGQELWDVYDSKRNRTGKVIPRGQQFADGEFHQVIHVCILNAKGQMLIQQRQPWKKGWPNQWDFSVGGNSIAGEDSQQTARRELEEELGIQMDFSQMLPQFSLTFRRGFDDFYIVEMEVDSTKLHLQYEEVQAVKWADEQEILRMIESEEFIDYHPGLIQMIFDMNIRYGSHSKYEF